LPGLLLHNFKELLSAEAFWAKADLFAFGTTKIMLQNFLPNKY
jgi:hypothetical protein